MIPELMVAAGVALLVFVLVREAPSRAAKAKARVRSDLVRVRSVLVGALMMTAGLALLLVHRLDKKALPRVLAGVNVAMLSITGAQRMRR